MRKLAQIVLLLTGLAAAACSSQIIGVVPEDLSGSIQSRFPAQDQIEGANGVHSNPNGVNEVIAELSNTAIVCESPFWACDITWHNAWMFGDGNQDGYVNLYDITRIGGFMNHSVEDDWRALPGDYDGN